MSNPKEGQPLDIAEFQYLTVRDLIGVLSRVGVPTPLQEGIIKETAATAALSPKNLLESVAVEVILDKLPSDERDRLEERIIEVLKGRLGSEAKRALRDEAKKELRAEISEEMKEVLTDKIKEELGPLFDIYLGEVARRVFGFRLGKLSAQERQQIEYIRNGLKIRGEFNPDAG